MFLDRFGRVLGKSSEGVRKTHIVQKCLGVFSQVGVLKTSVLNIFPDKKYQKLKNIDQLYIYI